MTPQQRANFARLLNPRHIAFVGGTDAGTAIKEARRRGFAGQIWAVNPTRADLAGVPCVRSLDDLPEVPDAAYVAVPVAAAFDAVARLAAMGAGGAVCYSAGFREAGPEGAAAEDALKRAAGNMAVIGPNCYGLINYVGNSALWSFEHGSASTCCGAAIVTQSGMLSSDITMSQRSLPIAYMVSAGNQTVLGLEDFVDAFADDDAVRAIGLHIEGLQDIPKFERAALKALAQSKPIVALKTGTSAVGGALTISHTGSLSGSRELYQALFERTGVISVTSPAQLLETLKYLCVVGAPKGLRVAGFTCSGGGATMLADHAEGIGLEFPTIAQGAAGRLKAMLPSIATVSNPLDYTTPIWGQFERTKPVFAATMQAVGADCALLVQDYPLPGLDQSKVYYQNDAAAFAEAAAEQGLPAAICATLPENLDADTRALLIQMGVAPMQGLHETLNAIAAAAGWTIARTRILGNRPASLKVSVPDGSPRMLTEDEGKAWVKAAGLPVPEGRTVAATEAADAADAIGYPVVLKMMGEKLAHKTEAGAVMVGLDSFDAVARAVRMMQDRVAASDPDAVTDRFLVEKMLPIPLAELLVGLRRDPQFGYALTLGSGGVLVELVGDSRTLLLPCAQADIETALASLKVARLLAGYRGGEPADLKRIASDLYGFCMAMLAGEDSFEEVEINPLFVYPAGVVAVDVLMRRTGYNLARSIG